MRLSFCLSIFAACLLMPSVAAAHYCNTCDNDTYVGVELGSTTISPSNDGNLALGLNYGLSFQGDTPVTVTHSSSLSSTSREVEAGVWFNTYVGMQISYMDSGTVSTSTQFQGSGICYISCTSDFIEIDKVSVSGLTLALTGRVPLPNGLELLGRYGLFGGNVKYEEDTYGLAGFGGGRSSMSGSSDVFGVGLGWRFSHHWGVELWWDQYSTMGNTMAGNSIREAQFGMQSFSLALQYHF